MRQRRVRRKTVAHERPLFADPIDYGGRHPFEKNARKRSRRRMEKGRQNEYLDFEPIRIVFDDSSLRESLDELLQKMTNGDSYSPDVAKTLIILYHVLPKAYSILADVVRVIPVQGALFPLSLAEQPENKEFYCPSNETSGIRGGGDLLIYVTKNAFFCGKGEDDFGTAASALSCERDQFDRPVTGSIDFCFEAITTPQFTNKLPGIIQSIDENFTIDTLDLTTGDKHIIYELTEVAIHEILHVLGFTSDSLPFFRNPLTGQPLTPRPFRVIERKCLDGEKRVILGEPSESVLGESFDDAIGTNYFEIRTPLVAQVVRNHFDCQNMTGARLENQPTSPNCFGSHWDERLHYSELMSAYLLNTKNSLSPLTLAFLEDTSWYRANYQSEYVQTPSFGHLAGCDFVDKPCIVNGDVPSYGIGNFCNTTLEKIGQDARPRGGQICDPSYKNKAYCDLKDIDDDEETPKQTRIYFPPGQMKSPHEFTHAEFCPIASYRPTSCLDPPSSNDRVPIEYRKARERFSANSRCVEVVARDRAICLESICNTNTSRLQLVVLYGLRITCQYDGEIHTLLGSAFSGNDELFQIRCPNLSQVCPHLICPENCSGRGECVYDKETGKRECVCFDTSDSSSGCYNTNLDSVYSTVKYTEPKKKARVDVFLFFLSIVIFGLLIMYIFFSKNKRKTDRSHV
mmetsp:Transcript_14631/g.21580  ORF Transcript_14631/g.21580 Transcript_14631/m.21580 type:complete len:685 (+) Transcript_14631:123-2177(+)